MERRSQRTGYARVSTEDQNPSLQLDALNAAGCSRIFCDEGVSGVAAKRPALAEALACLKPGDALVTWKLDRLGRSLRHLIEIIEELERRDIGFCSLCEALDTTTAGGTFVFHIFGAVAQFERTLISQRTKAGMESAKARGATLGRPLKLTDAQVHLARQEIAAKRKNMAELAAGFGVSPLTVARALKRLERPS